MNKKYPLTLLLFFITALYCVAHADVPNQMINNVSESIYQLYAVNKDKQTLEGLGSAVAITKHYLATNCHVAFTGNFLVANINNKPYLARLCYYNKEDDLCIIDVAETELKPANVKPSTSAQVGDPVFVIGYPQGEKEIGTGKIKAFLKENNKMIIITDAKMSYGSSGGGLFNQQGELIGITTGGIPNEAGGYAIPTELILNVIDPKNLPKCAIPFNGN